VSRRFAFATVLAAAFSCAACTSASSSVSAPTAAKCQIEISGQPPSFPATGGSGSIAVTATRDCTWSASADASWVALATKTGQGPGSLAFTVAANPAPSTRSGAIVVESARVAVSQAAAPCRYGLSRSQDTVDSTGGRLSVDVTALAGCTWTATSAADWIAIQSGHNGNGNGTVVLSAAANAGGQRTGVATIAGQSYTVTQSAALGTPTPPAPQPPAPAPTPAPAPSPTPPPPPPPPPPPDPSVDLSGSVSSMSGHCPDVSFSINRTHVTTDGATDYRGGSCRDLKNKKKIAVTGVRQPNGTVRATRIDLNREGD